MTDNEPSDNLRRIIQSVAGLAALTIVGFIGKGVLDNREAISRNQLKLAHIEANRFTGSQGVELNARLLAITKALEGYAKSQDKTAAAIDRMSEAVHEIQVKMAGMVPKGG